MHNLQTNADAKEAWKKNLTIQRESGKVEKNPESIKRHYNKIEVEDLKIKIWKQIYQEITKQKKKRWHTILTLVKIDFETIVIKRIIT